MIPVHHADLVRSSTAAPRFSVFIPIWNEAAWLPGAIESVLRQTYQGWELVIGDNASSDDLESVANRYGDPRIHYHRWSTHVPIYENFNRTMWLCHYEWVQALGADDRLHPRCLERLAEQLIGASSSLGRVAAAIAGCRRVDAKGRPAQAAYSYQRVIRIPGGRHDGRSWLQYAAQPGIPPWNIGAVALSREVLAELGGFFRPDVGLGCDVELVMRASAYGDIQYVAEPLLDCTVRGASDRTLQAQRNRQRNDPMTPMGAAYLSALRAHEARRRLDNAERRLIYKAVARSHLQRAVLHRYRRGGGGRAAALVDVARAVRYYPGSLLDPGHLGYMLLALAAPASLIETVRHLVAERRHAAVDGRRLAA